VPSPLVRRLVVALLAGALGASLVSCNHYHKTDVPPADVRPVGRVALDLGATKRRFAGRPPSPGVDDWTMYAHDALRSAYEPQDAGIERGTLAKLKLAWHVKLPGPVKASPIVAAGSAYFATRTGMLVSLVAKTGVRRWATSVADDEDIAMTPTLADGEIFVGTESGTFAAVDAASGKLLWKTVLPGVRRSEPVVVGRLVIEGLAGGDPPACIRGGVDAFDEKTGVMKWTWSVSDRTDDGGGVWSPLTYDGRHIYFGTGNTCHHIAAAADAIVSLSPRGVPAWIFTSQDSRIDVDLGGATQLYGNVAVIAGKDGTILAVDASTGKLLARRKIPYSVNGFGGIGGPSTDGTTLIVTGGSSASPEVPHVSGSLAGFDRNLNVKWKMRTPFPMWGYVAIADGLGFTALAKRIVALDPATGKTLWSAALSTNSYASPAVVPSGLYAVDLAGDAYAFRE
jgi:outer membrane protein assembly factor BamB